MALTDTLKTLLEPDTAGDPVQGLLNLAKTFTDPLETVAKRPTPDPVPVHEVEFDVPAGPVTAIMPEDQDLGLIAKMRGYGALRDGKRLVLDLGAAGQVTYLPHGGEFVAKSERGRLVVDTDDPEDTLRRLGFGDQFPHDGEMGQQD